MFGTKRLVEPESRLSGLKIDGDSKMEKTGCWEMNMVACL
jgi:hypothetical protein